MRARFALGALGAGVAASIVVGQPAPRPAITAAEMRLIDGVSYVSLNDLLRATGGVKRFDGALGLGSVTMFGQDFRLLAGSPVVASGPRAWNLRAPVVASSGQIFVPEGFVATVLGDVAPVPVRLSDGRLFIDARPGRVDSVSVRVFDGGREVSVHGLFPAGQSLRIEGRSLSIDLPGCIVTRSQLAAHEDGFVRAIRIVPSRSSIAVGFDVGPAVEGYAWRERSDRRLRLIVGAGLPGLERLSPLPDRARARVGLVALDPGHGGEDLGVRANGVREKWLTLELARVVADTLLRRGFEVVLTRNADRSITPEERAEIANGAGADAFISFQIEPYAAREVPDVQPVVHLVDGTEPEEEIVAGFRLEPWEAAQRPHRDASRALAAWIARALPGGREIGVKEIPLRVLRGVDAPAVTLLVSSSMTEPARWSDFRRLFASAVVRAIDGFGGRYGP